MDCRTPANDRVNQANIKPQKWASKTEASIITHLRFDLALSFDLVLIDLSANRPGIA
jgi:hypothetical protein